METIDFVIAVGTIGTVIVLSITLYFHLQDRKPHFAYEKYKEGIGIIRIKVTQPNKRIHHLSVKIDGIALKMPYNYDRTECALNAGEGVILDLPNGIKDDSNVVIKFDRHRLKMKFKDIPWSKYTTSL